MFDLTEMEIASMRGPVGLAIGSRTPAEIAIAILAELIQVRAQQLRIGGAYIDEMRCETKQSK
jgi:xanthine dehydrogenase accessory factor